MKRRDIQALRGFSVLAVLLFHLQLTQFKGGFLGVDIFFVISGFVITERLAKSEGSFKSQIIDFYQRRAKRILPASLFVIALTALLARLFLAPISLKRFGLDGIATTFFAGNLRFSAEGNDYLTQSMSPTPYLHYWSLGVEEQFYLLWPILFLLFFKAHRKLVLPLFAIATIFALWYTHIAAVNSFYLPFSRAWEFFAGIVVALLIPQAPRASKSLAIFGWVTVLLSVMFIGTDFAVPGITTLAPVVGSMAILIARSVFTWEPILAWFGELSFSIYLIHWPLVVIALSRYQGLGKITQSVIGVGSILIGYLISRFIEIPFRYRQKHLFSLRTWALSLAAIAAMVFTATNFTGATASNSKFSIDLSEPIIYHDRCHLDFGISIPPSPCIYGDLHSSTLVVLAGDSHAAQWFNALNSIAIKSHWKLLSLTKSSCPAAFLPTVRNGSADGSCAQWQRYIAARINSLKPSKVILTGYSEYQYSLVQSGSYPDLYAQGQLRFDRALGLPVSSIYYIEDSPHPVQSVVDCLSGNPSATARCNFPLTRSAATIAIKTALSSSGAHYMSFSGILCPRNICTALFAGHNAYRDGTHISVTTSTALSSELELSLK